MPTFVRAVIANLSALHADLDSELDLAPGDTLLRFAEAQLASLEPILAAPRPAGRSTLFNTNLVGAFSIPGMGTASKVDQGFSALAKETAEGLRTRLRCGRFSPYCASAVGLMIPPRAGTASARTLNSHCMSSGSRTIAPP